MVWPLVPYDSNNLEQMIAKNAWCDGRIIYVQEQHPDSALGSQYSTALDLRSGTRTTKPVANYINARRIRPT
jgi:hypothetical protein